MNRTLAIAVLICMSAMFCAISYAALHDIARFQALTAICIDPAVIDYSSFWMGGFFCFVTAPLMAINRNENWHRLMFAILIALFFAVPFGLHHKTISTAADAGYSTAVDPGLFYLDTVAFGVTACR